MYSPGGADVQSHLLRGFWAHVSLHHKRHIDQSIRFYRTHQGVVGRGRRRDGVPPLFSTGGCVPHSPLFWTEIRAKVSPLLQLVTY